MSFLLPSLSPLLSSCSSLHQIELLQVVSEDGVFDGHKDEADVFCVCGAGKVRVQRLVLVRVLFLVHFQDEFLSCCRILLRSCNSGLILFQYVSRKQNIEMICMTVSDKILVNPVHLPMLWETEYDKYKRDAGLENVSQCTRFFSNMCWRVANLWIHIFSVLYATFSTSCATYSVGSLLDTPSQN